MPFTHDTVYLADLAEADGQTGLTHMQGSRVVEIDGVFIGAAVLLPDKSWRFVATHPCAQEADGIIAPTLHDAQQAAKRAFVTSRLHPPTPQAGQAGGPRAETDMLPSGPVLARR